MASQRPNDRHEADDTRAASRVLILGSGIAGLSAALKFAKQTPDSCEIAVVCKAEAIEGATRYAQGGIASVWSKQDTFEEHKQDTLAAGAGLCREDIVDLCVREGPERVQELIDLGVEFTKPEPGSPGSSDPAETFDLHREGGMANAASSMRQISRGLKSSALSWRGSPRRQKSAYTPITSRST